MFDHIEEAGLLEAFQLIAGLRGAKFQLSASFKNPFAFSLAYELGNWCDVPFPFRQHSYLIIDDTGWGGWNLGYSIHGTFGLNLNFLFLQVWKPTFRAFLCSENLRLWIGECHPLPGCFLSQLGLLEHTGGLPPLPPHWHRPFCFLAEALCF